MIEAMPRKQKPKPDWIGAFGKEVEAQHPRSRDIRMLLDGLGPLLGDGADYEFPPDYGPTMKEEQLTEGWGVSMPIDNWRAVLWAVYRLRQRRETLHPAVVELVDAVRALELEEQGLGFDWGDELGPELSAEQTPEVWERLWRAWMSI